MPSPFKGLTDGTVPLKHIWLDHIKISRIGRQFLADDKAGVSTMTISNSEFDRIQQDVRWETLLELAPLWKAHGRHDGQQLHARLVGPSPKAGGITDSKVVTHIANTFFKDNSYHSMEIGVNAYVLAEGNYFMNATEPLYDGDDPDITGGDDGSIYAGLKSSEDECTAQLGRVSEANMLVKSGAFGSRNGTTALAMVKPHPTIVRYTPKEAQELELSSSNFGVGELK